MQHKATRSWSLPAVILALVLAAALVAQFLTQAAVSNQAFAAQTNPIADGNTTSYKGSLGDGTSTRYAGRVWTDKTVYTEDAVFRTDDGLTTYTIEKGDSDFLVAYSALATSQAISGETKVPIDVVFVIDLSGSMDTSMGSNRGTRAENTVDAVNTAIRTLMNLNEYTRVAVVAYSDEAQVLLPLKHYGSVGASEEYLTYNSGWGTPSVSTGDSTGVNESKYVTGGTNTQAGTYMGMDLLASTNSTTVSINGQQVNRVPSVILLSDGQATFSSDSTSWWAPANNYNDGQGNGAYAGNGMKLMMTAAYMKDEIDRHYNVTDPSYRTTFYTVGMGITGLSGEERNLADISLNPGAYWNADNDIANEIRNAWNGYAVGGSPEVQVGDDGFILPNPEYYTFNHPDTGYDITSIHDYVDQYYDADDADTIAGVFEDIVGNIAISRPSVPTETDPAQPSTSGYITYTDPIGQYMEVEDVKEILWSGQEFKDPTKTDNNDGSVTYTFQGEIDSEVYGKHSVKEIQITVTTDPASGNQTLTVKIPATCIPLRVNSVTLDSKGKIESNVSNGAYPLRLLYTVGLKDNVVDAEGRVNTDVVTKDYIAANTENGRVNFYSNQYSGKQGENGKTQGDATVSFSPSLDNPFYFVQENTPLYTDPGCTVPAKGNFDRNATYYFKISYYEGMEEKTAMVGRSGSLIVNYVAFQDNQWHLEAGAPRLGYLTDFIVDKTSNTTNTAQTYYYPTFEGSDPKNGSFVVYLGNNGKLQVDEPLTPPGDLTISKTVGGNQGETESDKDFTFEVTLTNTVEPLSGPYAYTKTNTDATQTSGTVSVDPQGEATFTPEGGVPGALTLKDGESVTISDLPAGTSFTVTEQDPNTAGEDYKTSIAIDGGDSQPSEDRTASGLIESDENKTVAYHNHWEIQMHSFTFTKIDGSAIDKPLEGAKFKLFEPVCQDPSHNHEDEPIEDPFEPDPNCWKLLTDGEHADGVFTSDQEGKISFNGLLKNGVTYRLIEVQAPDGFQRPQGQWNLTMEQQIVGGETRVHVSTKAVGAMNSQPAFMVEGGTYYLPNYRPVDPPITGGRGMAGFMLGGGLLVALGLGAASFWLIRSSKQKRNGYRYH